MNPRRVTVVVLLVFAAAFAGAQSSDDFLVTNGRTTALGGRHTALADDFQTLFANPAGLLEIDPRFSYSELTVGATGPVFSIAGIVLQTFGGTDFATLLASESVQDLLSSIYARFTLDGPISFGYAGAGMGFGVFNDTQLQLESTGSSGLEAQLGERFLLRGGYGIPILLPEDWDTTLGLGMGVKGFLRGDAVITTSLLTLPSLLDNLGPDLLLSSPFELSSGIGLDLGLRAEWAELLAVALTVDNLYAPTANLPYPTLEGFLDSTATPTGTAYDTLPQEINLGLAWAPGLGPVGRYVQDLTLLFDYRDIFDFWLDSANAENLALKMSLGLEATFLKVLSLRGGFGEGLFAAGLGVDMTYFELNASMYGRELSTEPGLRPVYNILIGLEFRG